TWLSQRIYGGVGRIRFSTLATWQRHHVFTIGLGGVVAGISARRAVGVERRPFIAGSFSQHIAQLEEDHDRRNQKKDCPEVEKFHRFRQPLSSSRSIASPAAIFAYRTHPAIIQIKA